jgi:hypothetical protein
LLGTGLGDSVAVGTGVSFCSATVGAITTRGVELLAGFGRGLDVVTLAGVALARGALVVTLGVAEGNGVGLALLVGSGVTVGIAVTIEAGV